MVHRWLAVIRETFAGWWDDKAPRLGAALAYYTVLALAPVVIVVTPIAGAMFRILSPSQNDTSARRRFACVGLEVS